MERKKLATHLLWLAVFLAGCSQGGATEASPTHSTLPSEASDVTEEPATEVIGTNTPIPHGTLHACVYMDGEAVEGYVLVFGSLGLMLELGDEGWIKVRNGCANVRLVPGTYDAEGRYFEGPICSNSAAGCISSGIQFEIQPDQVVSLDFEVRAP